MAEALWKGKPVIAGVVGGIPEQIVHKQSRILVDTGPAETAFMASWFQQLTHHAEAVVVGWGRPGFNPGRPRRFRDRWKPWVLT